MKYIWQKLALYSLLICMKPMGKDSILWQIVLTKYPKTVAEFKCKNEKKMMDLLRERYYNQLYDRKRENEILGSMGAAEADNRA
jgi:hypothetical protein